jgi:DNA-binding response OmpR family regulator
MLQLMLMDNPPITSDSPNGKLILCIEDEHFISELYARALIKAGYQVNVVFDGAKGLEEAKTGKYDIILLDIMVPNLIGTEILKALRQDPSVQIKSKIIITTNLEQDEEGRAAVEAMADGYVVKAEMTPKQLVEFLSQIQ